MFFVNEIFCDVLFDVDVSGIVNMIRFVLNLTKMTELFYTKRFRLSLFCVCHSLLPVNV